jgi:catechol 2,3-dioxygenase-like lactoylglutathione lyase family enzyme
MLASLSARVHILVQPSQRDAFISLFKDTLGCSVVEHDVGMGPPILFVAFGDGSSFSAEFNEAAPAECGTWLEFRTGDVSAVQQKLRDAGVREFRHGGSPHAYFSAPGGQVFRVVDLAYRGP